jgi:hypothetical protein
MRFGGSLLAGFPSTWWIETIAVDMHCWQAGPRNGLQRL